MMPQNLPAFRERKLRFDASKPVRFSRIRHCLIASLPQNRVRFSRPVKENQGLTIVAKAKKTLSACRLSRKGRKGSGGTTPPKARHGGSGTASPHPSTNQNLLVWLRGRRASASINRGPDHHHTHPRHLHRSRSHRKGSYWNAFPNRVEPPTIFPSLQDVHTTPAGRTNAGNARRCWSTRRRITPHNQAYEPRVLRTGRWRERHRDHHRAEATVAKAEEALAELGPLFDLMRDTRERFGVTTAEVQEAMRAA